VFRKVGDKIFITQLRYLGQVHDFLGEVSLLHSCFSLLLRSLNRLLAIEFSYSCLSGEYTNVNGDGFMLSIDFFLFG
jgi:hypothetical protein